MERVSKKLKVSFIATLTSQSPSLVCREFEHKMLFVGKFIDTIKFLSTVVTF
jgi:hypothetical protein